LTVQNLVVASSTRSSVYDNQLGNRLSRGWGL